MPADEAQSAAAAAARSSKPPRKPGLLQAGTTAAAFATCGLPAVHRSLSSSAIQFAAASTSSNGSPSGPLNKHTKPVTPPITRSAAGGWSSPGCGGSSGNRPRNIQSSHRSRSAGSASSHAATAGLSVAEYETASADALQAQVQVVQDAVGMCQAAYAKARADVTKCMERIQQLEQQISSLDQEQQQLSVKAPLPVNRLLRVRQWLADRNAELAAEQAALEGKQMALLKAESQLRSRETEADLLAEAAGSLNSAAAGAAAAALKNAAAVHELEVAAAERKLREMQAVARQADQQEAQQQAESAQHIRAANEGQAAAKRRLAASQAAIKAHAAALEQVAAAEQARRRDALLSLKSKIEEVRENVEQRADKFRQLQKQKREQERREFEQLQEQGLNPYEVYRCRDAEAAAAKAAAELAKRQAERLVGIAAVLADEEKEYKRRLKREEQDRKVEEQYQREMGIAAQQQRTDAYMRSHTLSGQSVLDPTSHLRPYPSQSVLVKPPGFGLGRASPEAVSKVAGRHPGALGDLKDSLLLPSRYREDLHSSQALAATARLEFDSTSSTMQCPNEAASPAGPSAASDAAEADGFYGDDEAGFDDRGDEEDEQDDDMQPGFSSKVGAGSRSGSKGRKVAVRAVKLSKFEADRLQQAKQQHKAQVSQPKASFGRTFAGDAFIADPPEVVFKDFVPGETYKASVQLINRSFTKNSIRLLEVPAEVVHVIELDMPPSGCLAPGAAATLRVTFTPKSAGDLSASIPLLSETGPLSVRLSCLARRALPSLDPCPIVSLNGRAGGIMLAATGRRTVTLSNAGALAVAYDIKVLGPLASTTEYEDSEPTLASPNASAADVAALHAKACAATSLSVAGFRVQGIKGQVQGYGSCTFTVEFTPLVAGDVEVPLLVRFVAPDNKALVLQPVQLTVTATGRDLPVSTLTPLIDFKSVMFGQTYAAALLLANASKSAMKALVVSRPELNDWIEFTPDFGFIQAGDTLSVSVSLKPTPDMLRRLAKYLLPETVGEQQGLLEVPLQVNVPGQTLPVPFKLHLQPTTTDLYLSPLTLDFGRVPLSESAGVYLSISNPSLLPQTFTFGAKLPTGLSISPGAGYGRVLPGETLQLLVKFQPPIPGVQYFGLTCRTLAGRVFRVEGKCEGLELDVTLSHNVIKLPATAVNDAANASVILHNSSSTASHLYEFGVPAGSHLQLTPRVGCLKPGSSIRVQLDFAPPLSLMGQSRQAGDAAAAATIGAAAAAAARGAAAAQVGGAIVVNGASAGSLAKAAGSAAGTQAAQAAAGTVAAVAGSAAAQEQQKQQHQQQQPQQLLQPDALQATEGSSSSSTDALAADGSSRWMWYKEWLLPCYTRPAGPGEGVAGQVSNILAVNSCSSSSSLIAGSSAITGDARVSQHMSSTTGKTSSSGSVIGSTNVLHLSVTTCAVTPELQLVSPALPKPPGKNYYILDFGALPVGDRCTKQLVLANQGADVAPLSAAPLDPSGVFAIVNALRPVDGCGGSAKLLLAFAPQACCEYYEVLAVRSAKSRLRVALKGRGIAPSISVSPATATSSTGGLTFGDVLLSDPVSKELMVMITNTCPFTITYNTQFIGPPPPQPAAATQVAAAAAAAAAGGSVGLQQQQQGLGGLKAPPGTAAVAAVPGSGSAPSAAGGPAAAAAAAAAAAPRKPGASPQAPTPTGAAAGAAAGQTVTAAAAATAETPTAPSNCFYCQPRSGALEAGQTQELTVVLAPAGAAGQGLGPCNPYVSDRLQILVPCQQQDVVVPLQAGVWPGGVFISGLQYRNSGSSSTCGRSSSSSTPNVTAVGPARTGTVLLMPDPFAAAVAAAAAAAAAASAASAPTGGAAAGKTKQGASSSAAAGSQQQAGSQAQQQGLGGGLAAALAAAGFCDQSQGFVTLPGPIGPGQSTSISLDFGAVKASFGGAAGELLIEELPVAAKEAGWALDGLKLSAPAGERRPLVIRYTAPLVTKLRGSAQGALADLGLPLEQTLQLNCSMKGGCQPVAGGLAGAASAGAAAGSDGVRRLTIMCKCVVQVAPQAMQAAAAAAAGPTGSAAAVPATSAGQPAAVGRGGK